MHSYCLHVLGILQLVCCVFRFQQQLHPTAMLMLISQLAVSVVEGNRISSVGPV